MYCETSCSMSTAFAGWFQWTREWHHQWKSTPSWPMEVDAKTMGQNGELLSTEGYPVLDAGGAPLQLDPRGGPPTVGKDGSLRQGEQLAGAIGLFNFQPGENFVRFGNSGVVPPGEPEPIVDRIDVGVAQGFVEQSNVNPVLEMTRLIQVQRAFENVAALVRQTGSTTEDAIQTLGSK